jgi:tRNA (Thr-GGU) A37 N-methylase
MEPSLDVPATVLCALGVSTRHPDQPNPIVISTVSLLGIIGNILDVGKIDILDEAPLLDIKPHVNFDSWMKGTRVGWLCRKDETTRTWQ